MQSYQYDLLKTNRNVPQWWFKIRISIFDII